MDRKKKLLLRDAREKDKSAKWINGKKENKETKKLARARLTRENTCYTLNHFSLVQLLDNLYNEIN